MKGKGSKGFKIAVLGGLLAGMTLLPRLSKAADDNFLCDYPHNDPRAYQFLRWMPEEFPLKVYIPPVTFNVPHPEMYVPLVQQAYANWTQASRVFKFQFVDNPDEAQIVVSWLEYFPQNVDTWGEATLPKPYVTAKHELRHKSLLHLAVKAQPGSAVGSLGAVPFSYEELLAIATHEAGHTLGMPHSDSVDDMMSVYLSRDFASRKWTITQRDINTLFALYRLPPVTKPLTEHPCASQ